MRITNRTGRKVHWRTFSSNDGLKIAGLKSANLETGAFVDCAMGQGPVQIEFKEYANRLGGGAYAGHTIHGVSQSELFSNRGWVVLAETGKPIAIDKELRELMNPGSAHKEGEEKDKSHAEVGLEEFLAVTNALVDGLIAGFAKTSIFLGGAKMGVGLAGAVLSVFGDSPQPKFPDLQQISDALERVLEEHEAKTQRSHIFAAIRWFDTCVRKSAAMAKGKDLSQTSIDLSTFDRKEFEDELNDILDGHTELRGTLSILESNRQTRRFVIAEYIFGFSLWLHL